MRPTPSWAFLPLRRNLLRVWRGLSLPQAANGA